MPPLRCALHRTLLTGLAACGLLTLAVAHAAPLAPDHPLIGTWKITLPNNGCVETYHVHADGTSLVTSAHEVSESEFEISAQPSEKGFYKWVDKIVKDNGKPDCSGQVTQAGHVATNYILLRRDGQLFLMCEEEDLNTCIGPFVRADDEAV